jgi:hypothetical protein
MPDSSRIVRDRDVNQLSKISGQRKNFPQKVSQI